MINHSCNPNCEVTGTGLKVWVHAIKDIHKGKEFSYDYGFSYDEDYKITHVVVDQKIVVAIVREGSRWRIKKEKTKVDIILPNYNSSKFIIKTIKSILKRLSKIKINYS